MCMMRIPVAVCLLVAVVYSSTRVDARAAVPARISIPNRVWRLEEVETVDKSVSFAFVCNLQLGEQGTSAPSLGCVGNSSVSVANTYATRQPQCY